MTEATFLSPTINHHHILIIGAIDVSTPRATTRLMIPSPCLMPFETVIDRVRVIYCRLGVFFVIALSAQSKCTPSVEPIFPIAALDTNSIKTETTHGTSFSVPSPSGSRSAESWTGAI